jgi:putative enoyl reductase mmyQ
MREGQIVSTLPEGRTEGQWMADMLPDSVVVRAFSHTQEELLVSRAGKNPGVWAVGYATDALEERPRIESLLEATGYVPVFVGTLAESSLLDPGGSVFPHLFTAGDLQHLAAVHRLPRMLERFNAGDMSEVLHDKVQWSFPYGPTLGVQETFIGKEAVVDHLRRVRDSGVRISDIRTELETPHGAVVHAEGVFPTAQGPIASEIVSVVTMKGGLIGEVREYWDTAAIKG